MANTFTEQQVEQLITQMASSLIHMATYSQPVRPHAKVVTGPATATIPHKTKSFNVINLGPLDPTAARADIPVAGITDLTAIPQQLDVFGFTIENDQNHIAGPITVTVPSGHRVVVQYLL